MLFNVATQNVEHIKLARNEFRTWS